MVSVRGSILMDQMYADRAIIREVQPRDLGALYRIALRTGKWGSDASLIYRDPDLVGHVFSAPYLALPLGTGFVVDISGDVLGYCVGTADTESFNAQLEAHWWPALRQKYIKPDEDKRGSWNADDDLMHVIYEPVLPPQEIVNAYPGHLHMNLMPQLQRQGFGPRLLEAFITKATSLGADGFHLGADRRNKRGVEFWRSQGFDVYFRQVIDSASNNVWMVLE